MTHMDSLDAFEEYCDQFFHFTSQLVKYLGSDDYSQDAPSVIRWFVNGLNITEKGAKANLLSAELECPRPTLSYCAKAAHDLFVLVSNLQMKGYEVPSITHSHSQEK